MAALVIMWSTQVRYQGRIRRETKLIGSAGGTLTLCCMTKHFRPIGVVIADHLSCRSIKSCYGSWNNILSTYETLFVSENVHSYVLIAK